MLRKAAQKAVAQTISQGKQSTKILQQPSSLTPPATTRRVMNRSVSTSLFPSQLNSAYAISTQQNSKRLLSSTQKTSSNSSFNNSKQSSGKEKAHSSSSSSMSWDDFIAHLGVASGSAVAIALSKQFKATYNPEKMKAFMDYVDNNAMVKYAQTEARQLNQKLSESVRDIKIKYKKNASEYSAYVARFLKENVPSYDQIVKENTPSSDQVVNTISTPLISGTVRGTTSIFNTPLRRLAVERTKGNITSSNGGYYQFLMDMRKIGLQEGFRNIYRGFPSVASQGFKVGAFVIPTVKMMESKMSSDEPNLKKSPLVLAGIMQTFAAAAVHTTVTKRDDHTAISNMNNVKPLKNLLSTQGLKQYVIPAFARNSIILTPGIFGNKIAKEKGWNPREKNLYITAGSILATITSLPINQVIIKASKNQSCAQSELNTMGQEVKTMMSSCVKTAARKPFKGAIPMCMVVALNNIAISTALDLTRSKEQGVGR